ncbi:discoidin domain-containing protein [uncultured Rubinisphaera sp.]|uniref:DUF7133 domain-containing protein n=1 Tax=uncultured Rubinisphaera sp. TaxID=1678686 RepID=UPI0030D8D61F
MFRPALSLLCVVFLTASQNTFIDAAEKPIKALLITGGCCHDYARQQNIIAQGVSARADVEWTIVHQGGSTTDTKIPVYEDDNWADGFDIIVHNECFAGVKDKEWTDRILKPHQNGTPAILIHCAMHCYRTGDDRWFEFCGVQSPGHGPHYSFRVENLEPEHSIMKDFGSEWLAPKGELYHSVKLFDTATPLAHAKRQSDNEPQICIWTNQYQKARVFATTIGHYNITMADPHYLDMLTRGLLWAVGREDQPIRETDEETNDKILALVEAPLEQESEQSDLQACCGAGNLAFGRNTKAKSEETSKINFAKNAVDGNLKTRFCPNGGHANEWWQVDLEKPEDVKSVRIHWEGNTAYQYKIEASADGNEWKTIVDESKNQETRKVCGHKVDSPETRYLKVTYLGSKSGGWGSFWEFEAYAGDLPELPKVSDEKIVSVSDVKAPAEFEVRAFGLPPEVNYPVCLSCAPTGEVFVGVDEMGSLGKEEGRGKILRCADRDGDGKADEIIEFAKVDHPRGLIYDQGKLWVLHPPQLTLYHDDDLDGKADRSEVLIEGISTDQVGQRGADHTTNGIRMGIDGWIYIAVGDYGVVKAVGKDGTTLNRRGGGIIRIRPDGTEMEFFAWGLRNILDVCIDPYLNVFTRDNTNDGGGWDIRVTHILQGAEYGYPSWYANFAPETMPPLADYGGGSGCGGMYLHESRWPEGFRDALYTCDWGRSEVYIHRLPANGPTFDPHQDVFLNIPRPTDLDVDGSGLMYVGSWKNGRFAYDGPNIGFVAQIRPKNFLPKPFPDLQSLELDQIVEQLRVDSSVYRLHAQQEILRRGVSPEATTILTVLASDRLAHPASRVAAIFTLKQLNGEKSTPTLVELTKDESIREFALKALTDIPSENGNLPVAVFVDALKDSNPRVQAQALISLARIKVSNKETVARQVLPLTSRTKGELPPANRDQHKQADPGRVIPHLAVRTLVALDAGDVCVEALDGSFREGALWALKYFHQSEIVEQLIEKLKETEQAEAQQELVALLIRLYFREGDYDGGWWGTRPDHSGPYFDRTEWSATPAIAKAVRDYYEHASESVQDGFLKEQLVLHKVSIDGLPEWTESDAEMLTENKPIAVPQFDPNNKDQIGNLEYEEVVKRLDELPTVKKGNVGKKLFISQSCNACHTVQEGETPKGPHLMDIGKRYKRPELIESILKPSAKIAQGFDTYIFVMADGKQHVGFVTSESAESIMIRKNDGVSVELLINEIDFRKKQEQSMMPKGMVNNLTAEQFAELLAYLESLKSKK